jgi:hypothetical protein
MRILSLFAALILSSPNVAASQQATTFASQRPRREPQAAALLEATVSAMGGTIPVDSVATGNVTIVAGSQTSTGATRILTRGTNQTSIQFQTTNVNWSVIYSNGQANRVDTTGTRVLPMELAASSQCLYFPFPFLSGLLNNSEVSLQYVGQESLDSSPANHIRVQNTYASSPSLQFLSDFTTTDIWLDASTALPVRISLTRRNGGGSSPKIPISFSYSNYKIIAGVLYPFSIQEFLTGTLWAATSIQSVTFNTGLSEKDFPVSQEAN